MRRIPLPLQVGIAALAYFLAARLGQHFTPRDATLWPANGVALGLILTLGPRVALGVFGGAALAYLSLGTAPLLALALALVCTIEPLVARALLASAGFARALRVGDVMLLIGFGALLSAAVGAVLGVGVLSAFGLAAHPAELWRAWWLESAMGALVIAPMFGMLRSDDKPAERPLEAALVALVTVVVAFVIFVFAPDVAPFRHAYLNFSVIIWASMRFELRGATLASFATALIALVAHENGRGPFQGSLMNLQTFVGVMSATGLVLSAVIAERAREQRIIREQHADNQRLLRQAEAAVRARDEFLSIASHELKTPLSALVLQLEVLDDMLASAEPKVRAKVERAIRATARLRVLVERLAHHGGQAEPAPGALRSGRDRAGRDRPLRRRGAARGGDRRAARAESAPRGVGQGATGPGVHQLALQRDQVRPRQAGRDPDRRDGRQGHRRGARSRHRDRPGGHRAHLRALRAGRARPTTAASG